MQYDGLKKKELGLPEQVDLVLDGKRDRLGVNPNGIYSAALPSGTRSV